MPRAEAGSVKDLSKRMKLKGLQRLRFYCQPCERQMRDENGFKQHCLSESHVRQMLLIGENPKTQIEAFSNQFKRDFLQLLRTSHNEKSVGLNHFYQGYIANKEHVHMNATKWPSLTEFAKYLGREGICRVEETDKGIQVAWIDDSPDALRRKEAVRRKEMQDKGDEEREQRMIQEQMRRAQKHAAARNKDDDGDEGSEAAAKGLVRQEGEKIKLNFGWKSGAQTDTASPAPQAVAESNPAGGEGQTSKVEQSGEPTSATVPAAKSAPISLQKPAKPQTKNVFAAAKKNALAGGQKKAPAFEQPKKMSEVERIMREEQERKRSREGSGFGGPSNKRQRT